MAVETNGVVSIKGDTGPGFPVRVIAEAGRLRIESDTGLVGDWSIHDIGLHVLDDGFAIRAEGEELFLRADDDVGVADELGVAAATPRMARKLAARHNPDRPLLEEAPPPTAARSNLPAIGVAIAGILVIFGAVLISQNQGGGAFEAAEEMVGPLPIWVGFLTGGMLMMGMAYFMSRGRGWARASALLFTVLVVGLFAMLVNRGVPGAADLTAYAFVAAGMVVGIAVLVGGDTVTTD